MLVTYFDTRYEDAERFKTTVENSDSGGVRIELEYWVHMENSAINPDLVIHMNESHARQLYEKLDDHFTQKNVKALKAKLHENPAKAVE